MPLRPTNLDAAVIELNADYEGWVVPKSHVSFLGQLGYSGSLGQREEAVVFLLALLCSSRCCCFMELLRRPFNPQS